MDSDLGVLLQGQMIRRMDIRVREFSCVKSLSGVEEQILKANGNNT